MTFAPDTLLQLGAYWVTQNGVNLGIVGNVLHVTGYHLGRDRIYDGSGPGIGDQDYSVQMTRDRNGLSNAASAIDLGALDGSLANLRDFSRWLVARCQNDPVIHHDIREIIYSPDGVNVKRYSGVDNIVHSGAGNGDASHLSHTHISYYRDSEFVGKIPAFSPYFEVATVPGLQFRILDHVAGLATVVGPGHAIIRVDTGEHVGVPAGQVREVAAKIVLTAPAPVSTPFPPGTVGYLVGNVPGLTPDHSIAAMLLTTDCTFVASPVDCGPAILADRATARIVYP